MMVWGCFTGEKMGPLIVCDEEGVGAQKHEDILYDGLFSLVHDLLEPLEDPGDIQVVTENAII